MYNLITMPAYKHYEKLYSVHWALCYIATQLLDYVNNMNRIIMVFFYFNTGLNLSRQTYPYLISYQSIQIKSSRNSRSDVVYDSNLSHTQQLCLQK